MLPDTSVSPAVFGWGICYVSGIDMVIPFGYQAWLAIRPRVGARAKLIRGLKPGT